MPPAGSKVEPKGVSSWFTPQIVPIFTAAVVGVVSALFVVGSTWEGLNRDIEANTELAQKAITQASATRGHVTVKTNELVKPLNELVKSVAVLTDALYRIESGQAEVNGRLEREILLLRNGAR